MKSTGMTRCVDDLGRIVLPVELRRTLDMAENSPLEVYTDGEQIILKKYEPDCTFCGNDDVVLFKGKNVCRNCRSELAQQRAVSV